MSYAALLAQHARAVRAGDRATELATLAAMQSLARTSPPPAEVIALGIKLPPSPTVTMPTGPALASPLARAIADAKQQMALTPEAFAPLSESALDNAINLTLALHAACADALNRLTAAAKALRAPGAPSAAWMTWRAKADVLEPAIARAQAATPTPLALIAALYQALGPEPQIDDGGAAEHAEALAAVVALLG